MTKKDRYKKFISHFLEQQPDAQTELHYNSTFELLIAVILSAQCTDKRVNIITPALFENFPTPESLAATDFDTLFPFIRSISYPNNKTKHLIGMATMLVNKFNSEVPKTADELQLLPGVGRKTANVILSVVYHQPTMAVDTHVYRVSRRLGLVSLTCKTPLAVENELVKNIPKKYIHVAHHWLILHGRYVCTAKKPQCSTCLLTPICKQFTLNKIEEDI